MALIGPMRYLTIGDKTYEIEASGGSVTSVGVDNATGESDFTISGSPITSSGTITIEHANSTTAKSTQAVYPITFDKHGHITGSGSAVTIPTASDTYSSTSSNVMTGKGVNAALQTLDSSISATTGQAISAITITDGKIASSTKIAVGDANQNAFSNVKVGNTTIAADTTTDTLELAAGTDITLTPDATNDKVTVAFSNASGYTKNTGTVTQVTAGTGLTTTSGSSTDGGNITTSGTLHLTKTGVTAGTYQGITVDDYGRVTSATAQSDSDIYWVTYGTDINKTEFESAIADGKLVVLTNGEVFAVLQQYYDGYAIFSSVGSVSSGMCVFVTTADVSSSTTVWNYSSYGLETDVFFVDLSSTTLNWLDLSSAKNAGKVIVGYISGSISTAYYTFLRYSYNSGTYYLAFVGGPGTSGDEYVRYYFGSGSGTSVTWTTQDYSYSANAPIYGTCSTTASTARKEVTASGFQFYSGSILGVYFSTANTAATPTLLLNNSGSAVSIVIGNGTPNGTTNVLKWSANTMIYFMYDGTYFRYITSVSAGDAEPSRGANTWYGTSTTAAATQAKTSTINNFVLVKGALASIRFTYANTYTSAKITLNINSTGAKDVYYNGTVTSSTNTLLWNAGEVLTFMYDGTGYQYIGKSVQKVSQLTNDSGYITGISSSDVTTALGYTPYNSTNPNGYTSNTGTVTSVGISNATDGGLSISGSPVTGSGSITVGHSNVLTSAQTTQAVYPIKIDKNGHISSYGNAVTVPTITLNGSATTTPDFYAPTSAGTSNYFLKSSGSGAPSWSQPIKYGTSLPASGDFTGQVFILTE